MRQTCASKSVAVGNMYESKVMQQNRNDDDVILVKNKHGAKVSLCRSLWLWLSFSHCLSLSVSLFLSHSLSLSLSLSFSLSHSVSLSVSASVSLSLSLTLWLWLSFCISLSLPLSIFPSSIFLCFQFLFFSPFFLFTYLDH